MVPADWRRPKERNTNEYGLYTLYTDRTFDSGHFDNQSDQHEDGDQYAQWSDESAHFFFEKKYSS